MTITPGFFFLRRRTFLVNVELFFCATSTLQKEKNGGGGKIFGFSGKTWNKNPNVEEKFPLQKKIYDQILHVEEKVKKNVEKKSLSGGREMSRN